MAGDGGRLGQRSPLYGAREEVKGWVGPSPLLGGWGAWGVPAGSVTVTGQQNHDAPISTGTPNLDVFRLTVTERWRQRE